MNLSDSDVKKISEGCLGDADFMKTFKEAVGDMEIPDPQKDPTGHMEFLKKIQEKLMDSTIRNREGEVFEDKEGTWTYTVPEPSFCIKTVSGNKKVFINICKSKAIAEPMPMSNDEIEESGMQNEDLQFRVPISIGPARVEKDKAGTPSIVYDIAVNPTTLEKCSNDPEFKRLVCAMCLYGLKQKHEPELNADQYKQPNLRCKGVPVIQRVRMSRQTNSFNNEISLPNGEKQQSSETPSATQTDQPKAKIEVISETKTEDSNQQKKQVSFYEATKIDTPEEEDEESNKRSITIEEEGEYEWSSHKYPAQNSYWQERQKVPEMLRLSIHIPEVEKSIAECDVSIDCNIITLSITEGDAEPFETIKLKFPVNSEPVKARFVKKKKILTLTLAVQLPDEVIQKSDRVTQSCAEQQKEEEEQSAKEREQEEVRREHQERVERQKKEDETQQEFNKNLVEAAKSIQAGGVPPELEKMVTDLPPEEARTLLARLTDGKIRGDSVDQLLEKLPKTAVSSLINVIRDKLGLAPVPQPDQKVKQQSDDKDVSPEDDDDDHHHYGFDKMSEKLFGVKLKNRYMFALDL